MKGKSKRKCNCPQESVRSDVNVNVNANPVKLITGLKVQILVDVDGNLWRINWENQWETHSWFIQQFGTEYQIKQFRFQTDFYSLMIQRSSQGHRVIMEKEGYTLEIEMSYSIMYLGSRYRDFYYMSYHNANMFKLRGLFVPMVYLRDVFLGSEGVDIELRPKLPILMIKR